MLISNAILNVQNIKTKPDWVMLMEDFFAALIQYNVTHIKADCMFKLEKNIETTRKQLTENNLQSFIFYHFTSKTINERTYNLMSKNSENLKKKKNLLKKLKFCFMHEF